MLWGTTSSPEVVRERMAAVRRAEQRGDITTDLVLVRDEMMSSLPLLNRIMTHLAWTTKLQSDHPGGHDHPGRKFAVDLRCQRPVGISGGGDFLRASFGRDLCGLAGASIPLMVIYIKRRRRMSQFEQRFPEALDLLGRAVRAGHAFTAGLEMVAKESPEPVATEFKTTFEEQNFGLPLRDALSNMASRVPLVDVHFFVTALMIQKDTGGNLAEILDELSRVIRERFRIHREVQIKTAQGRLTAVILILLPVGMLITMRIMNPAYVNVLFEDPLGVKLLVGAGILQVDGAGVLWKIVHIEV